MELYGVTVFARWANFDSFKKRARLKSARVLNKRERI